MTQVNHTCLAKSVQAILGLQEMVSVIALFCACSVELSRVKAIFCWHTTIREDSLLYFTFVDCLPL